MNSTDVQLYLRIGIRFGDPIHLHVSKISFRKMSGLLVLAAILLFANEITKVESLWLKEFSESERIIGGKPATEGQFKYAVALKTGGKLCTASVIGPRTILTAAHCVVSRETGALYPESSISGFFGKVNHIMGKRYHFVKSIPHPQFNPQNLSNDIAVLKTAEDVTAENTIEKVCLARSDTPLYHYRNIIAMGWGRMVPNTPTNHSDLQYVGINLLNHSLCELPFPDRHICADGRIRGVCKGDSGGPLVSIGNNNSHVEIGVASYGPRMCNSFSIFTRVSAYTDWIKQAAGADGANLCFV